MYTCIKEQLGYPPKKLSLYVQAMTHGSYTDHKVKGRIENYERLEFLGDAVLGCVVAELVYTTYPYAQEGELSLIRDKIVNKEQLAEFASHVGIDHLLRRKGVTVSQAMRCNAMEAFLAAIYLDQGFIAFRKYICTRLLIAPCFSIDTLAQKAFNCKGQVVEWAQRRKKKFAFKSRAIDETTFASTFYIDEEVIGEGQGRTKKEAEQHAAKQACEKLNIA